MIRSIFVVEDDPRIGQGYARSLGNAEFEAQWFSSIDQALGAGFRHPDVILLDHSFPEGEKQGIPSIPELRQAFPGTEIIVFSNANLRSSVRENALRCGASDVWVKAAHPPSRLAARLRDLGGQLQRETCAA